eukprot:UN33083
MQLQNGLRTKEYFRYRKFCGRKVARVRRGAKLLKKREKREDVKAHILINLLLSERAWSFSEELLALPPRDSANAQSKETQAARNLVHAKKKLKKAVKWADVLLNQVKGVSDPITIMDTEGYNHWMKGELYRLQEKWQNSYEHYSKSQSIYALFDELKIRSESFISAKQKSFRFVYSYVYRVWTR